MNLLASRIVGAMGGEACSTKPQASAMRLSERIRNGAPFGGRGFQIQMGGKTFVMKFSAGAIAFQFVLSRAQWGRFLNVLKGSFRKPTNADAYAGFIFSVGKPLFSTVKPGKNSETLGRRMGFSMTRTSKREIDAIRKSNWANPVVLDYGGVSFHVRRQRFLQVRKTCLEFEGTQMRQG